MWKSRFYWHDTNKPEADNIKQLKTKAASKWMTARGIPINL